MHYKNILFDFDGTLADTREGIIRTVQGTLQHMSLPTADPDAVAKTIGLPLTECFRTATAVPDSRVDEAAAIYRDIFPSLALDHITLWTVMAIVSSRHHMSLDPLMTSLGVADYIPLCHAYGEDENLHPKPAPDLALKALSALGIKADQTLVVGDTVYDLLMGKAAGCHTCGVTYGNQSRQQLLTAQPTHLIDRFADLLGL